MLVSDINPSDTKDFGTTSDSKGGGGGWADPLLSHNSHDQGT